MSERETILKEQNERLERAIGYAMTTQKSNTDGWMRGFADVINRVLVADGDARRCRYDGQRLVLHNIKELLKD